MKLSKHAKIRMQQRGITAPVIDWLLAYEEVDYQRGAQLYYFNGKSRRALERDIGQRRLRRHEKAMNTFLVCTEDRIVTVGHLYQRVVRH